MSALDRLGHEVARAMGERVPPQVRKRVRARVLAETSRRRWWQSRVWLPMAASLVVAIAIAFWHRSSSLGASTDRGSLAEGDWLTATNDNALKVVFEDRGHATLGQRARARLAKLSRSRVELALESGDVQVDVKPQSGTVWSVAAGPFRVDVLGTAFEARWRPEREELEVRVQRGVVKVTGASLSQQGVELRAGETLQANARRGETVLGREPATGTGADSRPSGVDAGVPSPSTNEADDALPPPALSESAATAPKQPPSKESFRELVLSGKHSEALSLADELGFESLTNSLGAADLELLANAARYQKQASKASLALLAVRRRFPGSTQAATATFLLGRLAAEQSADYAGAAKWFLTYSNEYPTSPLVAEALGRRVQLLSLAGDAGAARSAAQSYLERYPSGAYASMAQGVLAGRKLKPQP